MTTTRKYAPGTAAAVVLAPKFLRALEALTAGEPTPADRVTALEALARLTDMAAR